MAQKVYVTATARRCNDCNRTFAAGAGHSVHEFGYWVEYCAECRPNLRPTGSNASRV